MHKTVILFFLYLAPLLLSAQFQFRRSNEIPVQYFQNNLSLAWTGGMDACQFSQIDLNLDGTEDVFVFDRIGSRVMTFVHNGGSGVNFTWTPRYDSIFPALSDWVLLADYDNDGHADLFTGFDGGFIVYKNMAADSGEVAFLPYPGGAIKTNRPGNVRVEIAVNSMDIPAIVDLDGDGDLDVLTYDQPGSRIEYHKNVCKDFYGHSDSLIYRFEEACWGHVME
ncbi:MAG: VCBS repeat-containing protein, partial [Bacteroidetes bacterium]